jgi:DNA-binding transcriptional LysR family regulator
LHRFKQQHPQVALQFESELTYKNFDDTKMDGCFRFAPQPDEALQSKKLFRHFAVPVAAPALLSRSSWNGDPETLSHFCWCHTLSQPDLWRQWTQAWDLALLHAQEDVFFDDADTALQAARNGIGVALAAWPLVETMVTDGELVRLSECHPQLYSDYYFVYSKSNADHRLQQFIAWLDQEIATL